MEYSKLKAILREYEKQHPASQKALDAYITFTENSFDEPYSKESRTYIISSANKAFIPGMGGYSIYGSSVDGSDRGVRLEQYMRDEHGEKNGWKVEECGLLSYLFVRTGTDGSSFIRNFACSKDAKELMRKEYLAMLSTIMGPNDSQSEETGFEFGRCSLGKDYAIFENDKRIVWNIYTMYHSGDITDTIQTEEQYFGKDTADLFVRAKDEANEKDD